MYKVYCDFDETITVRDVGTQIIEQFGTTEALTVWKDFDNGTKSAAECLAVALRTIGGLNSGAAEALFDQQAVKEGFVDFARFCEARNIELQIASDGFSFYIESILRRHRLEHIPIWTNTVNLNDNGHLKFNFGNERE